MKHSFYRDCPVLILGGLGFVGSNLALRLVNLGANVTVVDSLCEAHGGSFFNIAPARERIRVELGDICSVPLLDEVVRGQGVIFSLAAQVSHTDSMTDPLNDQLVNTRSQLALLECCRQYNPDVKIVFASTRQLYGRPQYLPVDESHPTCPVDVNGVSKLAAEMYYALYHRVYGLRSVSLRMTNTYGPRLGLCGRSCGFLGKFLLQALRQERIELFGTGELRRDFNFIDDVVEAFLLAGQINEVNGQAFNLGHSDHHSLREVVEILQRHAEFDYCCVPFPPEYAAIDLGDYYGDYSRFRSATGWTPRVSLDAGLAATVNFFRRYRAHYWESGHDPDVRLSERLSQVQG